MHDVFFVHELFEGPRNTLISSLLLSLEFCISPTQAIIAIDSHGWLLMGKYGTEVSVQQVCMKAGGCSSQPQSVSSRC